MTAVTHTTWICDGCGEIAAAGTLGAVPAVVEGWIDLNGEDFCPECAAEQAVAADPLPLPLTPGGHA